MNIQQEGNYIKIYVKTPEGKTLNLTVKEHDTVRTVKNLIKEREGCRRKYQQLFFDGVKQQDKELDTYGRLSDLDVRRGTKLRLMIGGHGGGKRGRAVIFNREERVTSLSDELQLKIMLAMEPSNAAIAATLARVNAFAAEIQNDQRTVITRALETMSLDSLQRVSEVLNSTNQEWKLTTLSRQLFANDYMALGKQAAKFKHAEASIMHAVQFGFNAQYLTDANTLDFKSFGTDLLKVIVDKASKAGKASQVGVSTAIVGVPHDVSMEL